MKIYWHKNVVVKRIVWYFSAAPNQGFDCILISFGSCLFYSREPKIHN